MTTTVPSGLTTTHLSPLDRLVLLFVEELPVMVNPRRKRPADPPSLDAAARRERELSERSERERETERERERERQRQRERRGEGSQRERERESV